MKKNTSVIPRGSKEYKELVTARDELLKTIELLENVKKQLDSKQEKIEKSTNNLPIIQKD